MRKPIVAGMTAMGAAGLTFFLLNAAVGGAAKVPVVPPPTPLQPTSLSAAVEDTAVFAGGCFWGIEGVFEHLIGVRHAESGYAGGSKANPTYEEVSDGGTGHAEAVRVVFDPSKISYQTLLHVFFSVAHDPTELNRQGPDVGTQYRSAIFYRNDAQRVAAKAYIDELTKAAVWKKPIVTEVSPLRGFHVAEDYHQDYMVNHPTQPYIMFNDAPKLEHLKRSFPELYRTGG